MSQAREAFDRLYGHLLLSGKDAAWHVFESGWKARAKAEQEMDFNLADLEQEARLMRARNERLEKEMRELREELETAKRYTQRTVARLERGEEDAD